jgi:uncharacterized membrane protein YkvA (DUF1232 family)
VGLNNWKTRAEELKREAYSLYLCSRHPRTPIYVKIFALLIVAYAMSPIDLIPDFIPVFGYLDDLVLIPLGIALLIKIMPYDILEECRLKASSLPDASKRKSWIGAAIIITLWVICIFLVYWSIRKLY